MVSTKITSSSVAEIDAKLKTFFSPMVKIEYLENCLRQMLPNDASRFCHLMLAEFYAQRLMYGPAAKNLESAADQSVTFKDKKELYFKEITYLLKLKDFLMIDKAFKKALLCGNTNAEKEAVKQFLKHEMLALAAEHEKTNKRSNAVIIYERLIDLHITNEVEKKELMAKVASLNSKMGKIAEAVRYEQMMKLPVSPRKTAESDQEVRKVSFSDLGLEEL